ncbi:MAG TPA: sulfatase, partial [Acidimicrobiia bacterium]|nr:sulfatase [Acidimicrobiia bacterium]
DIHATLCELFDVQPRHRTHGVSLCPLLDGAGISVREWALSGVWGREVHLIADHAKYVRAPDGENAPLSMWSNRWSTMPLHSMPDLRLPMPDDRAVLDRMPGSTIPVIRQPFRAGDVLPYWAYTEFVGTLAFDLGDDPLEQRNLAEDKLGRELHDMLRAALDAVDAPDDQLTRLGFS